MDTLRNQGRLTDIVALPFELFALWGAKFLVTALRFLPSSVSRKISVLIVKTYLWFVPRLRQAAIRNLELVFPESESQWRCDVLVRSIAVLAKNLVSFAQIPDYDVERLRQEFDYEEAEAEIMQIRQEFPDRGLLIVTAHYGSFELLAQAHIILGKPMAVLARGFGLARLDRWWNNRRALLGNTIFSRQGAYREVMRRIQAGEDVAMLCDQNVKRNHAIFVDFFGIKAATTKTMGLVALRTECPVVFAVAVDLEQQNSTSYKKRKIILHRLPDVRELRGSSEEKLLRLTEAMHQRLEEVIRAYPEQWFWIHRRFKTRPEGEQELIYSG